MASKIFIDGEHGTTGLQIRGRLERRDDLELLSLTVEDRRDDAKRLAMFSQCDVAILCLPDDAARDAVAKIDANGFGCKVIDTSTAHRIADDWVFGFAELDGEQSELIAHASRVSNPGCYSTGAIALLKPLIEGGILDAGSPVTINAVSGYTGGGKQLIAQMENKDDPDHIETSFHLYAMGLGHKHVPEIMARSGLNTRPIFMPSVARFPQGMLVSIPLHMASSSANKVAQLRDILAQHYSGASFVTVASEEECAGAQALRPEDYADRDDMKLWVFGSDEHGHANLIAQLDNLGKGASGAAVQNLDLMLSVS